MNWEGEMKERSLDLRIAWSIWNIAILIPVLIPLFCGSGIYNFVPSLLAYCYAILAVGYYLFDRHQKVTIKKINYPATKKSLSILAILGILTIYILFNLVETSLSTIILASVSPIILLISLVLAYFLNTPLLKRQEEEEEKRDADLKEMERNQQETRDSARREVEAVVKEELK